MPSERELLSRIQSDVARLVQAVADTAFWRDRWVAAAEQESQPQMAAAATTFQQVTADVQATFERRSQQAVQEQQRQLCEKLRIVESHTQRFQRRPVRNCDHSPGKYEASGSLTRQASWRRTFPALTMLPAAESRRCILNGGLLCHLNAL